MSTLGTIVDLLGEVPEAIGLVRRLVERVKATRPENRAAVIAAMETAAENTHRATVDAYARLAAANARADEPTAPHRIGDTGQADP